MACVRTLSLFLSVSVLAVSVGAAAQPVHSVAKNNGASVLGAQRFRRQASMSIVINAVSACQPEAPHGLLLYIVHAHIYTACLSCP